MSSAATRVITIEDGVIIDGQATLDTVNHTDTENVSDNSDLQTSSSQAKDNDNTDAQARASEVSTR